LTWLLTNISDAQKQLLTIS